MATKGIQGRRVTDDVGVVSIVVMPAWLKRILQAFGVDKAIGYSSLARIIQAAGGAFTIFFVAANLTSEEQGYYYTFGSLLAVQIFFDLGVNFTISQYVAYEYAFLKDNPSGTLEGGASHLSRLASLFRLFSKWYLVAAILLLFVLLVSGYYFFALNDTGNVNWLLPWILLAVSTSLNLLISPYLSMLEGMGKVKDVAFMRLIAQILHIVTVWGVLLSGGTGRVLLPYTRENCIVIPQEATFELQDKVFVYKIVNGVTKSTMITVSPINNGQEYIVESGLELGDVIIATGAGILRDGISVGVDSQVKEGGETL